MGQAGKERRKAAKEGATKAPKAKLSHRDKAVQDAQGMAKRLTRLTKKLAKLPADLTLGEDTTVPAGIEMMSEAFDNLAAQIAALPSDWKPTRGKRGNSLVVEVGDPVRIREKNAPKYADMLPPGVVLTVAKIGVALIEVQLPDNGAKVLVPRGHLEEAKEAVQA